MFSRLIFTEIVTYMYMKFWKDEMPNTYSWSQLPKSVFLIIWRRKKVITLNIEHTGQTKGADPEQTAHNLLAVLSHVWSWSLLIIYHSIFTFLHIPV